MHFLFPSCLKEWKSRQWQIFNTILKQLAFVFCYAWTITRVSLPNYKMISVSREKTGTRQIGFPCSCGQESDTRKKKKQCLASVMSSHCSVCPLCSLHLHAAITFWGVLQIVLIAQFVSCPFGKGKRKKSWTLWLNTFWTSVSHTFQQWQFNFQTENFSESENASFVHCHR